MRTNRKKTKTITPFAIRTPKAEGNEVIKQLQAKGLLDYSRKIVKEKGMLWIPVKKYMKGARKKDLPKKAQKTIRISLREKFGIRAFEIIGDIIILFLPREVEEKRKEITEHLLVLYPKTKAIYRISGGTEGCYRVQRKELITGKGAETIHHENGLKFKLDVTEVFFSARQQSERKKLTTWAKKSKSICVFFSGIGVLPIYLAKFTQAEKIVGIELNEKAHAYALENLRLNKVDEKKVRLINGDVKKVVAKMKATFDMVIMPEPKNSPSYLEEAAQLIKEKKGKLIVSFVGTEEELKQKKQLLEHTKFKVENLSRKKRVGRPRESRYLLLCVKDFKRVQ